MDELDSINNKGMSAIFLWHDRNMTKLSSSCHVVFRVIVLSYWYAINYPLSKTYSLYLNNQTQSGATESARRDQDETDYDRFYQPIEP